MQTTNATSAIPKQLLFARHLIGMGIVALGSPLIYYSDQPFFRWLETWLSPIALAFVAFGLYALILTQRAKNAWPKSFFLLSWVLLGLVLIGQWSNKPSAPRSSYQASIPAAANTHRTPAAQPQQGSQIDEILKDAPAYQPAR